jgi:hypothetical protein
LVFGVGTWVFLFSWRPFIPPWADFVILNVCAVTAVVPGSVALRAISKTGSSLTGRGMAIAGVILGGVLVLMIVFLTLLLNLHLIIPD